MNSATTNDLQYRGISRTICIGLGGTGRDVLMRIRRLIVDRYGNLTNLPIISFVHLDTDKAATQVTGIRTGSTYHGVDLSFREAEKVTATMSSKEVTMFVEGIERRSEYSNYGPYDHIVRWFPPQLLRNIKAVEEGAKGIRPVGRLAFFHNYYKIQSAIETAERRTRGHESFLLKTGLKVEAGLNIFVVGSLCGGTGSGMFLDTAYSLRHLYGDQSAQIVGYLVISPELYGNTPNMNANTYAALKELNYYSSPGTEFAACYDVQNPVYVQEKRPPFDYSYLVSHQTSGEYAILTQGKLCNVIAHKIALDFTGELAPIIKGNRDNFLQHMIQSDKHPRYNSQRYLTFGLAAIYFPRDIVIQISLNQVSLELVNFWLNGKHQSPDPLNLLEQFLVQYRWHNDLAARDGLITKLSESVQESNNTFSNNLNTWRIRLERLISECQNKDDRHSIRQKIPREFREQFRKVQPGETESNRGIWLTRLIQVAPNLIKELQNNIDDYLNQLLTPINSNFSIKSSRDWLDALQHELNNYQYNLQTIITDLGNSKRLENIDKSWRDTEQILADIEDKLGMPFLNTKNNHFQSETKRGLQEICKIIKHNFDLNVIQETLKIVNALQKYVQDKITKITTFSSLVEDIKNIYEKQDSDLRQLDFDEMSGEAIFDNEDIERCHQIMLPEDDVRSQLVLVSSAITEQTGRGNSLAGFIDKERTTQELLQADINLSVDSIFALRGNNVVKSVIKRFMQNYSAARSTRLAQIMQEAEPLLRLNLSDPHFRDDPAKSSKLVGFKDTDELEVRQFKTLLTQDLGVDPSVLKSMQAEDEILFINEYAGFPLRLINSLERMQNYYLREQHSATSGLHNDYCITFPDIIPPDAITVEQLEDVLYPCLALELLQKNPQNQQLEFKYYDELRDNYYIADLSAEWGQALEELVNHPDMKAELKKILTQEIAVIARQPELWKNEYLPRLRKFVKEVDELAEEHPNYPYKLAIIGSNNPTAKEGIINRFRRKMNEQFNSSIPELPFNHNPGEQKTIVGEIVDNHAAESTDNMSKLRAALENLKQLLDKNLITVEDYERKKQKLLDEYSI
ncbi:MULTISPECIES: tubulin-like doman-containing protein [unclassified Anabaena]|uniref:tubulin-like doman-containing protein n=1 Tax=unclassified Anabaena TaxID=2619674 RepID=UPI0039C72956